MQFFEVELDFNDSRCFDARSQNILGGGRVAGTPQTLETVQKAARQAPTSEGVEKTGRGGVQKGAYRILSGKHPLEQVASMLRRC